ncbi:MAG: serine/threonine-protein kinase [Planctomycetaceae bacterium]
MSDFPLLTSSIENIVTNDDLTAEPLGMPRHHSSDELPAREKVEVLATQFIEELRQGLQPSIEDYAARFPVQAAEIRRLFPLVEAMENWKGNKAAELASPSIPQTFHIERLGNCRILREIGRGGMGVVFEGYQEPPGRRVAVKLLPWKHDADSPWREQFAHEARLAARLRHANIVPVYLYGEQSGFSYYVMPFIVGVGLDWIIRRLGEDDGVVYADEIRRARAAANETHDPPNNEGFERPVSSVPSSPSPFGSFSRPTGGRQLTRHSWTKIAKIGVQVGTALRYAHKQGLLHRDVKPANILLDADGVVWITDFGLARQIASVEETPHIAGTLRYMSPEQLVGSADERSDIYGLGITLLELCTLRPAFDVRSKSELKRAIQAGDIIAPRTHNPQLPEELEAIILKASAAEPRERYQSADDLTSDLLQFINGKRPAAASRGWFGRHR